MANFTPGRRRSPLALVFTLALAFFGEKACLGALAWGAGGAGGSGTWDDTSLNWSDGTNNVIWASGGSAVFGKTAGTVIANGETAASLAFETPGYVLGGSLLVPTNGALALQVDADATISASISRASMYSTSPTLTKTGTGVLTLTGAVPFTSVTLNRGEVRLETSAPGGMFFTLANVAGTVLTVDQSANSSYLISLAGGGANGGALQPANVPGTAQVTIGPATIHSQTFGGTLQDNGNGKLAVDFDMHTLAQTLTNVSTYTGPTIILSGAVDLSGAGTLANTPITIGQNATLSLDAAIQRISSTLPLTIQGGDLTVSAIGASVSTPLQIGPLMLGDERSTVTLLASTRNAATQILFAGITMTDYATLFIDRANVTLNGISNDATGIAPVYITMNGGWATVASDGSLAPFTGYATDLNASSATSHVQFSGGSATLEGDSTRASLSFAGNSVSVVDLGAHLMTLSSGGIYSTLSGNGANVVQNGQLTTSANEWVITNALGGLTISANLGETTAGTALTKTGAGTLTLSGTNTYSGVTTLQQGVLVATSDASLGTGSSVAFAGGSLQAGGNVSSAKSMTAIGTAGVLIDTSTFNVSLSGSITGILTKTGAGTLALTQAPSRFAYVNAGWLSFLNGTSGTFVLEGGNLLASGSIDYLDVDNTTGTLDVGGAAAANLTIGTVTNPYSNFTIDFGLGSAAADHLSVTHGFDLPIGFEGSFQFEFQNLGGLMTGVDYSLIDFGPGVTAPDSGVFQLAPDLVSDGWSATFTSNANGVSVNFSAIPEPGSGALLITAGIALAIRRRRPTSR